MNKGEHFSEFITESPEEIFERMKKSRHAGELSLRFPYELSMFRLLNKSNPLKQRYYFIENDTDYGFFSVYENRMNLFTYGKAEWFMNIQTIAFPCSLSCPGYVTNNPEWLFSYIKSVKGCKLILNADEKVKTKGMSFGETLPTCVLTLKEEYTGIEEYLSSLRSPYRRRINLARKRTEGLEKRFVTDGSIDVHPLYLKTYEKSEYKLECLEKEFFDRADGVKIVFLKKEKPVGFVLLHENDDELIFMFCGMDSPDADLYYVMLLSIVEYAISNGFKRIDFGQTSEKTKLKFGAELQRKYFYAHHSNPFLNLFAMVGKHMLEYKYEFPEYHVFKEHS